MKKMIIVYPDGIKHEVFATSVDRAINIKTGVEEIVLNYIDHSNGDADSYTPIINVDGKWYKKPEHADYSDYDIIDSGDKYIFDSLPNEIKSLSKKDESSFDKNVFYDDYVFRDNTNIGTYVFEIMNYIYNIIGNKNPNLLNNNRINSLLGELRNSLERAHSRFFNDDGRTEREIFEHIRNTVLDIILININNEEDFASALSRTIDIFNNFSREYYSFRSRKTEIDLIIQYFHRIGEYNPIVRGYVDMLISSLGSLDVSLMDSQMFGEFLEDIRNVISFDRMQNIDEQEIIFIINTIMGIIQEYKEKLEKRKSVSSVASAQESAVLNPPPGGSLLRQNEGIVYQYVISSNEFDIFNPSDRDEYRYNYIALPPTIFGKNGSLRFRNFVDPLLCDDSVITYSNFNNFDFKEIFENYVEKIKRSSNDFQTLCNVLNNVPLYIKHHNGVVDICYFGICDTVEKYRDVFYCYSFDVYIPDDCPFKRGSLFESAFRCALNGEYSMSLDVGEDEYIHYDGMLGSNKAKGM